MLKTFKYRLKPNKSDLKKLLNTLEICRTVYNKTLEIRKISWESEKKSISYFEIASNLSPWKEQFPELKTVHSQVLQDAMIRVDLAFKAFFKRVKSGDKPGYPRFKAKNRYDSFNYRQSGFQVHPDSTIYLSKIGRVPIILHRPLPLGKIKTCCIRKSSTNKWYASIVVNISGPDPFPKTGQIVGLDLGLKTFIQTSDGFKIPRKRFFNTDQHDLARVQRQLEKYTKGSKEREQIKKKIAHIHERIANRRKDFCHKSALDLVKKYDFIVIEDLNTKKMLEQKKFSKSISDVAWTQLRQNLSYKAEEAGKKVVAVNPRNTSQMCSTCGTIVPKDLNIRIHHCPVCGLKIDRDLNASLNILRLGMQSVEYRAYASLRQEHG